VPRGALRPAVPPWVVWCRDSDFQPHLNPCLYGLLTGVSYDGLVLCWRGWFARGHADCDRRVLASTHGPVRSRRYRWACGKAALLILHYRTRPGILGALVRRDEGSTHDMRS